MALNNLTDGPRKKVDLTYLTNIKKSVDGIKTRMSANGNINNNPDNNTPGKKKIKITDLQQETSNNNPPEDNTTTTETNDKAPESGTYFFDQKRPVRMDDILTEKSDNTKAPVYDYKKLEDKPIIKKIYRDRVTDPKNTEPTFPIAQPQETETGSIVPADNTDANLQQEELKMRTDWLDKINSGEINLPNWVNSLPDNQKLQYVGATYNNNPIYTAITTLQNPLLHLENVLRTGANKVLGTDLKTLDPANMKAENEDDKLIEFGVNLATNLIPLGASIKGANLLLSGVKSPMIRHMLSSGLGFMINSQPELLDNLTQGKMELKDYAIQNAVDFGTGVSFGLLPPGSPLKYEIPYQSIVPTMVPVLADILQGKEINSEEVLGNAITNAVLGMVMNGQLPKDTKVKEITGKIKSDLKGYAEEQITPELVNTVIAGYLPPARTENFTESSVIKRDNVTTETRPDESLLGKLLGRKTTVEVPGKPTIETVKIPEGRDVIEVGPDGTATVKPESQTQPAILKVQLTKQQYDDMKNNGMTDAEIQAAQDNLNKQVYPDVPKTEQKIEPTNKESTPEVTTEKAPGINITADPKAEIELKKEETRLDKDLKEKYNKSVIPEITSPELLNTQSEKIKERVTNLNEAIKDHNKQFETPVTPPEKTTDGRVQQLEEVNKRISELQDQAKTVTNKTEARKISQRTERLQEQRDLLLKGMKEDGISPSKPEVKPAEVIPKIKQVETPPVKEVKIGSIVDKDMKERLDKQEEYKAKLNEDLKVENSAKVPAIEEKTTEVKPAENKPEKEYSSTQVNIPKNEANDIIAYGKKIPENELYKGDNEAYNDYGRETEPHVTALYGLHDEKPAGIEKLIKNTGDIEVTLGKTSIFENDKYDVLKIDVDSPQLHKINKTLRDNLKYTSDFDKYVPHLTIAYLKKGEGKKYIGDNSFEGKKIKISELLFSNKDREKTSIDLKKETPAPVKDIAKVPEVKSPKITLKPESKLKDDIPKPEKANKPLTENIKKPLTENDIPLWEKLRDGEISAKEYIAKIREHTKARKEIIKERKLADKKNESDIPVSPTDLMKGKGKKIPKVQEKKASSDPDADRRKAAFERMTAGQLKNYIDDRSKYLGGKSDYQKSSEYKDIVEPIYNKRILENQREIKKEIDYEKNKLKNKIISKESYDKAIKEIRNRGKNLYSNPLDPSALKDLGTVGLYYFERGVRTFAGWSQRMIREIGEKIKPYLQKVWEEINNPKNVRKFKEDNPEAELHTSGLDKMKLRTKDGEPETYPQYAKRIAREYGTVPDREVYNDAKEYFRTSKAVEENRSQPSAVKAELTDVIDKMGKKPAKREMTFDDMRSRSSKRLKGNTADVSYMDKVYDKIENTIDEYGRKGLRGQALLDRSSIESTKNIFNDPEFKKFGAKDKKAIIKSARRYFNEKYKKDSQASDSSSYAFVPKSTYDQIKKHGFRQSLNVVKDMGESGKEFAGRMKKMADDERMWQGKGNVIALDMTRLTKEEFHSLEKIWDAKMMQKAPPLPLNENVKRMDLITDEYFKEIANEFKDRGFMTRNKLTGDIYLFTPRKDYRPRIMKIEMDKFGVQYNAFGEAIRNKERERVIEHLVQTGQAKDGAQAAELLDGVIAKNRIYRAGNVEYSRTIDFPEDYYVSNPAEGLQRYSEAVSKRLAFTDAWGISGDIANRLIDDIGKKHMDYEFAKRLFRYETGQLTPQERKVLDEVNTVKGFQAVTKFTPFTSLRNVFQGFLGTTTRGNLKAGIMGTIKALSPAMRRYAYESGAIADNIGSLVKDIAGGKADNKVGAITSWYLDMIQFSRTDRGNRIISALGGLSFFEDMLKRIAKDSVLKRRALREFEYAGLNADEILKRDKPELNDAEKKMVMRKFAYDSQFSMRPQDLPLYWSSGFGKLVTQWKPWSYKQTQLIRDNVVGELKHGNILPMVTFLTAYGMAGESVNLIIDSIRGTLGYNPRKDEKDNNSAIEKSAIYKLKEKDWGGFAARVVDDLAGLGALSFYYDVARSFGYAKTGDVGSVVSGPAIGEGIAILGDVVVPPLDYATSGKFSEFLGGESEDFKSVTKNTLKGIYKTATRNTPVVGPIARTLGLTKEAQKWLFDDPTSTDLFLKTLNDKEKKEYEKIEKLRKERDKASKKAIDTEKKEDIKQYEKLDEEYKDATDSKVYDKKLDWDEEKKKRRELILGK